MTEKEAIEALSKGYPVKDGEGWIYKVRKILRGNWISVKPTVPMPRRNSSRLSVRKRTLKANQLTVIREERIEADINNTIPENEEI